jgi:hypothetical protein
VVCLRRRELETESEKVASPLLQPPTHDAMIALRAGGCIDLDVDAAIDTLCRRRSIGQDMNSMQVEIKIS